MTVTNAAWVYCRHCERLTRRDDAYTPDLGGIPTRWVPLFCTPGCAETWSEINDQAGVTP